jgi:hypothetical protein
MKLLPLCGVKQQFSAETLLQRHAIAFLAEEAAVAEETTQTNDKKRARKQSCRVSLNVGAQPQT